MPRSRHHFLAFLFNYDGHVFFSNHCIVTLCNIQWAISAHGEKKRLLYVHSPITLSAPPCQTLLEPLQQCCRFFLCSVFFFLTVLTKQHCTVVANLLAFMMQISVFHCRSAKCASLDGDLVSAGALWLQWCLVQQFQALWRSDASEGATVWP